MSERLSNFRFANHVCFRKPLSFSKTIRGCSKTIKSPPQGVGNTSRNRSQQLLFGNKRGFRKRSACQVCCARKEGRKGKGQVDRLGDGARPERKGEGEAHKGREAEVRSASRGTSPSLLLYPLTTLSHVTSLSYSLPPGLGLSPPALPYGRSPFSRSFGNGAPHLCNVLHEGSRGLQVHQTPRHDAGAHL